MTNNRLKAYFSKNQKRACGFLNHFEVKLLKTQIRKNSRLVDRLMEIIDLLANKEGCPKDANTLASLRKRFAVAVDENDTFRRVLWRHLQSVENQRSPGGWMDPITFLVNQIRTRRRSLIAQAAMK